MLEPPDAAVKTTRFGSVATNAGLRLLVSGLTSIALPIVLFRLYGAEESGRWYGVTALFGILSFAECGLTTSLSRLRSPRDAADLLSWRAGSTILLGVGTATLLIACGMLAFHEGTVLYGAAVTVGCTTTLSVILSAPAAAAIISANAPHILYRITGYLAVARSIGILPPLLFHMNPHWIAAAYIVVTCAYFFVLWRTLIRLGIDTGIYKPTVRINRAWALLWYGLIGSTGTVSDLSFFYLSRLALLHFAGAELAGVYGVLSSIAQSIQQSGAIFAQYVMSACLRFVRSEGVQEQTLLLTVARRVSIAPTFAACTAVMLARPIVVTVLGADKYVDTAAVALQMLILAGYFVNMVSPYAIMLLSRGDAPKFALATGAGAIVNIFGVLALATQGLIPVVVVNLCSTLVLTIALIVISRKDSSRRLLREPFIFFPTYIVSLSSVAWQPLRFWPLTYENALATFATIVIVGGSVFLIHWKHPFLPRLDEPQ